MAPDIAVSVDRAEADPRAERVGNIGAGNVADTLRVSNSDWGMQRAASISRSELATIARDDALLVWLAGDAAGSMERGAGSVEERPKAEGGGGKVNEKEMEIDSFRAVDNVFEGLAVGV